MKASNQCFPGCFVVCYTVCDSSNLWKLRIHFEVLSLVDTCLWCCLYSTFSKGFLLQGLWTEWSPLVGQSFITLVEEIFKSGYSNESYWAVLSYGTVYYAVQGSSKFSLCGWNPKVWPFKWKVLSSTFLCYCLLCCTG